MTDENSTKVYASHEGLNFCVNINLSKEEVEKIATVLQDFYGTEFLDKMVAEFILNDSNNGLDANVMIVAAEFRNQAWYHLMKEFGINRENMVMAIINKGGHSISWK